MMVVEEFFFFLEAFDYNLNNMFIPLIPEKKVAKELKDFFPITLVNSIYKIIAKTSCCEG